MTDPKRGPDRDSETGRAVAGNKLRLTHGVSAYLQTRRLPSVRGRRRIQRELVALRRELLDVVPDSDDVRRRLLVEQVVTSRGVVMLAEVFLKHAGLCQPARLARGIADPQPVLGLMRQYLDVERQALRELGFDRKAAEPILAPYEIVEADK